MSIKSDNWIRRMAQAQRMIEPFAPEQVRQANGHKIVSYGTSSYGYDVRCASEFKIFTNINSTIVDPKGFDAKNFVDFNGEVCIIPPNSFALARTVEYFRIPRSVLTICLGKSTYARCFRGDTRVALVDGTSATLEEMAQGHARGELYWGYGIGPTGRLIVALLDAPRFIGRDSLLEVTLDNGAVIHPTPDHLFMRRDGRMTAAGDLRPGDSLMPLHRDLVRGYEAVYQPLEGFMSPTQRLAEEWNRRHEIYAGGPGAHRHPRDFDRRNNRPTSIARPAASEHIRLHNSAGCGEGFDPEAAIQATLRRRAADRRWRDGYSRAQSLPGAATRAASRPAQPRRYADPQQQVRHAQTIVCAWPGDDERRKRQADVARRIKLRPEIMRAAAERALHVAGSVRRAAQLPGCEDFGRFPDLIAGFHGRRRYQNHKVASVREVRGDHDVYCLSVPEAGNFALEAGVFVRNCGIIVNVTPLEPEWEGHVTLEFSNTTPLPAKIYANEGVAQMLFFESDEVCATSYKDRGGKYQGQRGVTLPKT